MATATAKQIGFIERLLEEREQNFDEETIDIARSDKREASVLIELLLEKPKVGLTKQLNLIEDLEPGMYRNDDGRIFKVQRGRQSGKVYAKELQDINGRRLTEIDEVVGFEFVYAAGAIKHLTPEHRLSLEEAKAFGIRFGVCCVCGATLKDATSVANGIGPVCGGRV